jgi:thioredoxin reductase (NADPH)
VSVCASCDGWAYKGKDVALIGGGNSALTEALHLKNLGVNVTIIHRRDAFRAEQHLVDSVRRENIPVVWNSEVVEFLGADNDLTGVRLKDTTTGQTTDMAVAGAFLAIGWIPDSQLAQDIGVRVNDYGFVDVDRHMRTNIPRIYACGDVIGGVQQIVTAVAEGATVALSLFEDLANPYWKRPAS